MSPNRLGRWPYFLILIGFFFIGLTGWAVYRSITGVSGITDGDYYAHGLRYNDTLLEQRAAESLGWLVTIRLENGSLACRLTGRDGYPVSGGEARIDIGGKDHDGIVLPLSENSAGHYEAPLPQGLQGETSALLTFRHGGAILRRPLRLSL